MTLATFLNAKTRSVGSKLVQTHTAFALGPKGQSVKTLHIASGDELRRELYDYVQSHSDLTSGVNSITEKVIAKGNFILFLDVDFRQARVEEFLGGLSSHDTDAEMLLSVLQEIPRAAETLIEEATGAEQLIIIATRLSYKIHLHFPGVVVNEAIAKRFCAMMETALKDHPLMDADSIDTSVYKTGLRLIWCHKGGMAKTEALQKEKKTHEERFGPGTWTAVYDITDAETWEKKGERTLEDLELTSIVAEDGAELTPLFLEGCVELESGKQPSSTTSPDRRRKRNAKGKGKEPSPSIEDTTLVETRTVKIPSNVETYLVQALEIQGRFGAGKISGGSVVIPSDSRKCPYAQREHTGNHIYVVLSRKGAELRCHNESCKKKRSKLIAMAELSGEVRSSVESLIGTGLGSQELAQIQQCVRELAENFPELDVTELSIPERTELDSAGGYLTWLPKNRYCLFHKREHDSAQTCVLTTIDWQKLICRENMAMRLFPMPKDQSTTIFANIGNLNLNVSVGGGNKEEDGKFKEVFPITSDEELNKLLLKSFRGLAYDIGKVVHHLGRRRLGMGTSADRDVWWVWNLTFYRWQQSARLAAVFLSEDVADLYAKCRDWFAEHTRDEKLAKVRTEKMEEIVKRLKDRDKQLVLKQVGEIFEAQEEPIEDKLDTNRQLLGFDGEVYDLAKGIARKAEPEDYVALSVGYAFPHEDDPDIQAEIWKMLRGMQPEEKELDYLLKFLASTLDGFNKEELFTIWTGGGRNGKSLLVDLMSHTLSEKGYFHPLQASFLTHERPGSSKPCPDLLNLRNKRFACASEPEGDQKMNADFVKLLTGNDMLTGSYKHSNEEIKFRGQHSLILLCNGIPAMNARDDALWMRSRVIEFKMKFVTKPKEGTNERLRDDTLKGKIVDWGPQFMRILLRYYQRYQLEGLQPTAAVLRATGDVQRENDPFVEFIEEHYEKTELETDRVAKSEVNAAFDRWCEKVPARKAIIQKRQKAHGQLKVAMEDNGFHLGEEIRGGKTYVKNKKVDGASQPAYSFIIKKDTNA